MFCNDLCKTTHTIDKKIRLSIENNTKYLQDIQHSKTNVIAQKRILYDSRHTIVIPKTSKKCSYTLYTHTNVLHVAEDENVLRFLPYIKHKKERFCVSNYKKTSLLDAPLNYDTQAYKALLDKTMAKYSHKRLQKVAKQKKFDRLAELTKTDVDTLVHDFYCQNGYKTASRIFCNVCLVFMCKKHKKVKFVCKKE